MQNLATAFNRQTLTNTEGGVDQEEFRVAAIKDRINTLGTVWLGLTIGCADCHSHKYDRVTQREYYQLFAFFDNADEANVEVPISKEAVARYESEKAEYDRGLRDLESKLEQTKQRLAGTLPQWEAEIQAELAAGKRHPTVFHELEIDSAVSERGATLTRQKDGSYLSEGENPDKDQYVIVARSDLGGITGFRVDALADDSLSGRGPGRTGHGNFVLSQFHVLAGPGEELAEDHRVRLVQTDSDFSQPGWPVSAAVDGKDDTGWAISPQMGKDHWAVFKTEGPLARDATKHLMFVLRFQYGSQHVLGRFRILARTGSDPGDAFPKDIRAILAVNPDSRSDEQNQAILAYYVKQDATGKALFQEIDQWKQKAPKRPVMSIRVLAQHKSEPRTTHIMRRGDFLQPGAVVEPATLEILHPLKARYEGARPDRLDLAHWLVDAANPLTPRVLANHLWSQLFGTGLVDTLDDFGVRGEPPTHPNLLDWLATELMRRGWSRKSMIKLIVTSATYRQASKHRPELAETDPLNTLLCRQNRFRVEAETVRDLYLAASGLLSHRIGGPSVYPPMPADVAALSYANNFKWSTSKGDDRYRRGVYTFFKRTAPHPNLTAFDCPDSNTTCVQRRTSNTPIQALTTLNNEVFVEAAQAMAKRVLTTDGQVGDNERLVYAFRLCVARPPSAKEQEELLGLLARARDWYIEHPEDAAQLIVSHQPVGVPPEETAAWVATTRVLLNMDEFIVRD
jgi:hypothetical protein